MASERGVLSLVFADSTAAFISFAPYKDASRCVRYYKLDFHPVFNLAIMESAMDRNGIEANPLLCESAREQFFASPALS